MKYDFVLLENLYSVENHYKDLTILAMLLKEAGYSVAIADAFKEADLCQVDGIPHLKIDILCPKEFKTLKIFSKKRSGWKNLYYRILKDIYLYRVIKKLKGAALNIYLGSMTMATPAFFFKAFDKNTIYYMWALRSANVLYWKNNKRDLYYYVSKALFLAIHQYHNLRLIVSNEIIKKEFEVSVGVKVDRLILRPERYITKKNTPVIRKCPNEKLNILYIGTIRPSKNIDFCLETIKKLNNERIIYTIAGRARTDEQYGYKINNLASTIPNVIRIDRYIPDDEYEQLIGDCDFMILCDKKESSCASNGTMTEALLRGKPIIAPDIDPFKYEVEKFGIGYLYQYGNVNSLSEVLLKALENGAGQFYNNINIYQDCFIFNKVANDIRRQIDNTSHE